MANEKKMTKAQMFAQIKANHNLSAEDRKSTRLNSSH